VGEEPNVSDDKKKPLLGAVSKYLTTELVVKAIQLAAKGVPAAAPVPNRRPFSLMTPRELVDRKNFVRTDSVDCEDLAVARPRLPTRFPVGLNGECLCHTPKPFGQTDAFGMVTCARCMGETPPPVLRKLYLSFDEMRLIVSALTDSRREGFRDIVTKLEIAVHRDSMDPTEDELRDELVAMIDKSERTIAVLRGELEELREQHKKENEPRCACGVVSGIVLRCPTCGDVVE
jgi:hypothetical protein